VKESNNKLIMQLQYEHIILGIIAFVIGALIIYLFLNASRVSRSVFDELKAALGATQNELDTQKALVSQFGSDREKLEKNLMSEQELNRKQEQSISELKANFDTITNRYQEEKLLNQEQQAKITGNQNEIIDLNNTLGTYSANNKALLEKLDTQKNEIVNLGEQNRLQFTAIAEKLLKEKTKEFTEVNQENIKNILNPLNEKIKDFEKKVELSNKESSARHSGLKELIKIISAQSQKVTDEAGNLAKALKGDKKMQGNWGEMVLQSILDKSGLEKGREYHVQQSERDHEGRLKKPDIVIDLPGNKKIIVDSKVSLVAYESFVSADDQEEAEGHVKNHTLAIRKHVKDLCDKNYQSLYQIESPDFVMMFIPIETAFSVALQKDRNLYSYAFDKNIIIVTPSTLLATLKTVESLWKNDKQNRYSAEIAEEAGKMYDKFVGFTEDMAKMGNQLNTVKNTYTTSMKKLSEGSGNLVRRAEKIKELGANTSKHLASGLK